MVEARRTGTREWSDESFNIGTGCSHNCLYCYARYEAVHKWKRVASAKDWTNEKPNLKKAEGIIKHTDGIVMFPTVHDITPAYLEPAVKVIKKMVIADNKLLIVSKPHLDCIKRICAELDGMNIKDKTNIMFRFTIGSMDENVCKLWEPCAPSPQERLDALKHAFNAGYRTSVSCEPMLGGYDSAVEVYDKTCKFVTDTIWFGKMRKIKERVVVDSDIVLKAVNDIYKLQKDEHILRLYNRFKDDKHVSWKDSIKMVLKYCDTEVNREEKMW